MAPSFLDIDTSNAPELKAVPGDKEYELVITGFIEKVDQETNEVNQIWANSNGNLCFMPRFDIPKVPTCKDFTAYYEIPHDGMTEKEKIKARRKIEDFRLCFKAPAGKLDLTKLVGNKGWAILGLKDDSGDYGEQNFIKKHIIPKK